MGKFYHKDKSKALLKVFERADENKVICVDGAWGSGKTFFCRRFIEEYEDCFEFVYIDAFFYDFNSDPLVVLLSEFSKALSEDDTSSYLKRVSELAVPILRKSRDVISVFDPSPLVNVAMSGAADCVEKMISDHLETDCSVRGIRNEIEKVVNKSKPKKLVVVVDELDRCRPIFSLEIIEKIKHIFNVEGVFFVLAMNKEQMLSSIDHAYGITSNKESYLEKFIDITITLTPPFVKGEGGHGFKAEVDYASELVRRRFESVAEEGFARAVERCVSLIVHKNNIGFREVDRLVDKCLTSYLSSDIEISPEEQEAHAFYLCACVYIGVYLAGNIPHLVNGNTTEEFCRIMLIDDYVFKRREEKIRHNYKREVSEQEAQLGGDKYYGYYSAVGPAGGSNLAYQKFSSFRKGLIDQRDAVRVLGYWLSHVSNIS